MSDDKNIPIHYEIQDVGKKRDPLLDDPFAIWLIMVLIIMCELIVVILLYQIGYFG